MIKKRRKLVIILIVFALIIACAMIYLSLPGNRLHGQYTDDVQLSFNETSRLKQNSFFTDEAIGDLPLPVQRYLTHCGYVDKPMMDRMRLDFKEASFAISQERKPINIHYEQYNFVSRPDRHAYIDAKMFGIPLNGKDTLVNGAGSMTIVLAKTFTLGHSTGYEMSQSQLIAALSDAVLMPSLFLQNYVAWKPIDDTRAECAITWGGMTASGTFTFNDTGEIVRFDTNDRYQDNNGESVNLPWTVEYGSYKKVDGFKRPGTVKIYWHMPDGNKFVYFESDHYTVSYAGN